MDSILVVCYSYTGVTRRLAQLLCSQHGWPLGEIHDKNRRDGWLRCVLDSLLRRSPRIVYEGPPPGDFRTVVLMSPIWAYQLAGPMRSFVRSHRDALRHVAVISTMGSAGASNAVREIARKVHRPPILSAAFTTREIEDGSGIARLRELGDQLLPPSTLKLVSSGRATGPAGLAAVSRAAR